MQSTLSEKRKGCHTQTHSSSYHPWTHNKNHHESLRHYIPFHQSPVEGAAPREEEGSGSWFKAGTDGRKDTWDSQGEELTAIKQPRSLEVSTTIKNRDVCTWVSDLSSLESASRYGVSTLLNKMFAKKRGQTTMLLKMVFLHTRGLRKTILP